MNSHVISPYLNELAVLADLSYSEVCSTGEEHGN